MDPVFINSTNYGRHWLDRPAADSWNRMVRDGCPPEGITDAGRTLEEQIDVFLRYFTTDYASSAKFDQRYWNGKNYWRRPGKPSAATPGSIYARHTTGRALDLNGATKSWVRANGHHYGWIKDMVKNEDWHMEYQASKDVMAVTNPGPSVPNVPTVPDISPVAPIKRKERTVQVIKEYLGDAIYSTDGVFKLHLRSPGQVNDMLKIADQTEIIIVGSETINRLQDSVPPIKPTEPPVPPVPPTAEEIAHEVWTRPIGEIAGKQRTVGQGVQISARAAAGEPIDK